MKKKITYSDFEEIMGPMNSVAFDDAVNYAKASNQENLTQDDIRTIRAKKQKIVKSDLKRQRNISKMARRMKWGTP